MCLLKEMAILIVLLAALIPQISASGNMGGGEPSDANSGIIIEQTGFTQEEAWRAGANSFLKSDPPSSFGSGYIPHQPGVLMLGPSPAGEMSSRTSVNSFTGEVLNGLNKLRQEMMEKEAMLKAGTLSREEYERYQANLNSNLERIKREMENLQSDANRALINPNPFQEYEGWNQWNGPKQ